MSNQGGRGWGAGGETTGAQIVAGLEPHSEFRTIFILPIRAAEVFAAVFMIRRYFLTPRVGAMAYDSSSRTVRTVARSSRMSYGLLTKPLAPAAKASLLEPVTE